MSPSVIERCSRKDPNPRDCIRASVEKLRTNLATGNWGDDFKVPKLEPLLLDGIYMDRGKDFKANFTDISVNGPGKWILEDIKVADLEKLTFDFILTLPKLEFTSKYSLNVRLAIVDIKGKGNTKGYFKNSRARVRVRGYVEPKDGKNYVRFRRIQVRINIPEAKFYLENLFNGDEVLGQLGNRVINENSQIFLADLVPGLENSLSEKFTDIINNVLRDATVEDMFPPEL
ncbi:protein takeout-like isoform X2 [Culicoides brevitarsis]|uniref:protein takeout-like isoform X2 n=1 Tax=Culicoides brevitarsis TaxID=469753 RepID=UPI00307CAD74